MISQNQKEYLINTISAPNTNTYLDTCSVLLPSFTVFLMESFSALKDLGRAFYLHRAVLNELESIAKNEAHPKRHQAIFVRSELKIMQESGLIELLGNGTDQRKADPQLLEHFIRQREKSSILLITQDHGLAKDALLLNQLQSYSGYPIAVFKITEFGSLKKYDFEEQDKPAVQYATPPQSIPLSLFAPSQCRS